MTPFSSAGWEGSRYRRFIKEEMELEHPIFARLYDLYMLPQALWGVKARRRRVVSDAAGTVLELGVGTGLNLPLYRRAHVVVAVEPDPHMIRKAGRRVGKARIPVRLVLARGEALPFPDGSFDTVIATLVFGSIEDAPAAAREIRRVLKSDGTFLFFEHFRSENPVLAGLQDAVTPVWRRLHAGCEPNKDIITIFREASLQVLQTTKLRGTFLLHGFAKPVLTLTRDSQIVGKGKSIPCRLS